MIKTIVVSTVEDVDIKFAIHELTSRIKNNEPLLRNSVGLLFCNMEFIKSGLVAALCKELPFEVIGCTSQIFAVQNAGEEFMLTLTILTSDDVEFTAGLSEPLNQDAESGLENFYRDLSSRGSSAEKPALMLVCAPSFFTGLTMNRQVDILDRVSGGVPLFGTVAIDITTTVRAPMTIFNGNSYTDRMAVILLRGNVHPRFISHSLPGEPHLQQKFTITEARGNRIFSIDNMPARDYFKKLGLVGQNPDEDEMQVIYAFPIVVEPGNGEPSQYFTISLIDEEGALVSGQDIPQGGTAVIGTISGDLVLASTRLVLRQLEEMADAAGIILISCFSRVLTLQDTLEEVNLVIKQMRNLPLPFVFLSSAGEICPVPGDKQGELKNKFHQFTIIACIL
jgi:hypothetical protein